MTAQRVACVVPALDAAATLAGVIAGLRASIPGAIVIVVDDGSRDETGSVARELADQTLSFPRNRGKGAALRAGIAVALGSACEVMVTADADGQHATEFAPALVAALGAAELAIGARARSSGTMPLPRRITNRLSNAAVARCTGRWMADTQSGFRAMTARLARDIQPRTDRYDYEMEFLLMTARRGHPIASIPVPTRYGGPVPSHFRSVRDGARIVRALWRHRSSQRMPGTS